MADSNSQRNPVELLAEEFLQRYRRGERPALSEYTQRYPESADEIRELFPLLVQMEGAAPDDDAPPEAGQGAERPQPTQIGDYRIVREIGRGGMGIVYEAQQQSLGRRVALKVLPLVAAKDDTALKRFRREARAAAKLHHTNIVPVFDVGGQDETCFYAMQFIQGQPLDVVINELRRQRKAPEKVQPAEVQTEAIDPATAHCARSLLTGYFAKQDLESTPSDDLTAPLDPRDGTTGAPRQAEPSAFAHSDAPLSPAVPNDRFYFRSVAQLGRQAADALAYAHSRGVIHRDIKPSNLLLDAAGVIWITDFGMAKVDDDALTHTGDILGTLRYMAPERFQGECDARADIYALGLTLYELLVLKPGFDSSDRLRLVEMISRHALRRPRSLDPRIPRDLETIVLKATEKDPRRRYQTAEELGDDLQRFSESRPIRARRIGGAERFVRWWQRNPVAASLSAGMVVLLVAAAIVSTLVAVQMHELAAEERRESERAGVAEQIANANADRARANAEESAERAEMLRREDYVNRVKLAYWEALDDDVARANELIQGCPEDLRGWEWDYVRRHCGLPLHSFQESAPSVNCISFSPDGKRIAVGTGAFIGQRRYHPGDLVVLDATTGKVLFEHRGLPGTFSCVAFSPDGSRIASGNGPDLTMWDAATGESLYQLQNDRLEVLSVAFSPDGRRLVAGYGRFNGQDVGYAKIIDTNTGEPLRAPIPGHTAGVWAVAFHPDGNRVALTSEGLVEVWDLEQDKLVQTFDGHEGFVYTAAFSHCGRYLATGGLDKTVRLWELESGELFRTFAGHRGFVRSVAFSPDNRRLVSASEDKSLKLWDVNSERELATYHGHTHFVNCVAFSRDATRIASGGVDQSVKVWFPAVDQQLTYEGHRNKGHVRGLAFSPTGNAIASGSLFFDAPTDRLQLWDPATGEQLVQFPQNIGGIDSIAFSPDGSLVAVGQEDGEVTLWEAATGRLARRLENHVGIVSALAFSDDGTRLASGGEDEGVNLWDPADGTLVAALVGHHNAVRAVDFSPDGRTLATADEDGAVILWNVDDATELRTLAGHVGKVWSVAFSPDGKWIASGGGIDHRLGDLRLWERETGALAHQLIGHTDIVYDLAFSPDGRRLASACDDRTVKLWNPETGREVFTLRGHTGGVLTVAFSPDGRRIASGSVDRTVKVWDLDRPGAEVLLRRQAVDQLERGRAHLARYEWEQALGAFYRASGMGLEDAELHRLRGQANLRAGRDVEADADFARALELSPDDPAALCKLGTQLAGLDRELLALAALNRAIQLVPDDHEVLLALARAQAQFGHSELADESLGRAVAALEQQPPGAGVTAARRLETGWWIAGPYPHDAGSQEQVAASPSSFRPDRPNSANEADRADTKWTTAWQQGDGYLDLGAAFGGPERSVGYALQHVYATKDHSVALLLGSNDTLKLYLNGELVHDKRGSAPPRSAQDAVPATLRRGWNTLLARVENDAPRHGLYVHISDHPGHLARAYMETGDLDAVISVWEHADESQRGDAQLLWLAGNALARRSRWNGAAETLRRLCERQPARNRNWVVLAPLLAQTGDRNAYDQLCEELISRFGHTEDPIIAERTAKACLLLPGAVSPDDPAVRLAEHAVAVGAEHRFFKYFQLAAGLAEYRAGDLQAAVETARSSRRNNAGADPYLDAADALVEAMALARLGRQDEARPLFGDATRIINEQLPQPEQPDLGGAWPDWLICHIALREAEALFASDAPSSDTEPVAQD